MLEWNRGVGGACLSALCPAGKKRPERGGSFIRFNVEINFSKDFGRFRTLIVQHSNHKFNLKFANPSIGSHRHPNAKQCEIRVKNRSAINTRIFERTVPARKKGETDSTAFIFIVDRINF